MASVDTGSPAATCSWPVVVASAIGDASSAVVAVVLGMAVKVVVSGLVTLEAV